MYFHSHIIDSIKCKFIKLIIVQLHNKSNVKQNHNKSKNIYLFFILNGYCHGRAKIPFFFDTALI